MHFSAPYTEGEPLAFPRAQFFSARLETRDSAGRIRWFAPAEYLVWGNASVVVSHWPAGRDMNELEPCP